MGQYRQADLKALKRRFPAFVGLDSDGCVFDSMAVKQKEFFHPQLIRSWGLERIAPQVRETASFVNLTSRWRGQNRFSALLKFFEFLSQRPCVQASGVALPELVSIRAYVNSGVPLGNPSLAAAVQASGDPELKRMLDWSLAVNHAIETGMGRVPAFAGALAALERLQSRADVIVVSQTPEAALLNEWRLHGIARFVQLIAGQELGTKAEHLTLAAKGKYEDRRILLIGDAPGDLEAAQLAGVCFYPIVPDDEEASWVRFNDEILDVFLAGCYSGDVERQLTDQFLEALPERPPWE